MLRLSIAALALVCSAAASTVTVTGTLCSGSRAIVSLSRLNATDGIISTSSQAYTNGSFSNTLTSGEDGSRYQVDIVCPSTRSTQYWIIPAVAGPLTTTQVSVASSVRIGAYYWDTTNSVWASSAAGINSAGGVAPTDATIVTSDVTTNNVSTSKHGWAPKAPNDATKYLDGTGVWSSPTLSGSIDPATWASHNSVSYNEQKYFLSAGTSTAYTGCPTQAPGAYTTGMSLIWRPHTNGAGGATTIDVCTLGAKAIKTIANADPSSSDIVADGRTYAITYDGTAFRLPSISSASSSLDTAMATSGQGWLAPWGLAASSSITSGVQNSVYVNQFSPDKTMTVSKLSVRYSGTGDVRAAIMDSACTTQLALTASTATAATSNYTLTFASPVTLTRNTVYYMMIAGNATTPQIFAVQGLTGLLNSDGSNVRSAVSSNTASGTGGSFTLPTSCGTLSATSSIVPVAVMFP